MENAEGKGNWQRQRTMVDGKGIRQIQYAKVEGRMQHHKAKSEATGRR